MSDVIKKLKFVHRRAPLLMQPRIARLIEGIGISSPSGVSAPIGKNIKVVETPISQLQDHADSFLALMRTLPKKHKFKELLSDMLGEAEGLNSKLEEAGTELQELLKIDEQDLPGIKASALGALSDMIASEGSKLSEVLELTKMLNQLAGKAHKEEKTEPVKHEMPSKDVEPDGKKDEEDLGIGDTSMEGLGPAPGTPAAPPTTPDLNSMGI